MDALDANVQAFFLYRDSALRREALALPPGAGQRYSLFGLDEVAAAGIHVEHNLEGPEPPHVARIAACALDRAVRLAGGYSGNFRTVLASRRALNRADVVFSTVDTVGIPLTLLARAGLVQAPIVYAAVGLPERIAQLRTRGARRYFRSAYRRLHTIVAYGAGEVDALRTWLGGEGPNVVFIPFGADPGVFRPRPEVEPDVDIVSVGADPRRDYDLLLALAQRRPGWSFRVVASRDQAAIFADAPGNVVVETDLPFDRYRDRLASGRLVVLPVRDNTYSGATTVLLQAMASARPVVVSKTAAIADGYYLLDGSNCSLVPPGELDTLEQAAATLLDDIDFAAALGTRARETVERHLTWERYASRIGALLRAASAASTVPA